MTTVTTPYHNDPYTDDHDMENVPDVKYPVTQPGAPNPYHAGYDQPTDDPGFQTRQQGIQMQSSRTATDVQQPPKAEVSNGTTNGTDQMVLAVIAIFCCLIPGIRAWKNARKAKTMYSLGQRREAEEYRQQANLWIIVSFASFVTIGVTIVILYYVHLLPIQASILNPEHSYYYKLRAYITG